MAKGDVSSAMIQCNVAQLRFGNFVIGLDSFTGRNNVTHETPTHKNQISLKSSINDETKCMQLRLLQGRPLQWQVKVRYFLKNC